MSDPALSLVSEGRASPASNDAPPFELFNPAGRAPVALVCDHATRIIPPDLDHLGLDEAQLSRHIAWDIGIADLTRDLALRLDAPAVLSRFSRLIIDPNRHLDDPTLVPQISDGVVVPGNRNLSDEARAGRIARFFQPYHEAVASTLDRLRQCHVCPAVVSLHSFTPVMKGVERPWQLGILWGEDPRIPIPLMERLRARGLAVGDNQPYSGRNAHGYTLHAHAEPQGLANVLIEVRQDLIDTRHGAAEWADCLGEALAPILADPAALRKELV